MNRTEEQIMSAWEGDSGKPLVSVICTVYNHLKYINRTVDGFLMQKTTFPFEILIHDDASSDGTTEIIKEYAQKYPHIVVPLIQTENQYSKGGNWGHPKTINPYIRGKYVALCEGDDYWTDSGKLEKQISYMESHPDCSMTFHAVNYIENGHVLINDRRSKTERDFSVEEIIAGGGAFCATSSLCCRTTAYVKYPRFRTMAINGDYPQQILMGLLGTVHYFPEIMGVYRYGSQGSWTEKMNSREGSIELYRFVINQIQWMAELDAYTDYRYSDLIDEQIDAVSLGGLYIREQEMTKLEAVYQSASWKLGNFLIQPLHVLKMLKERIQNR